MRNVAILFGRLEDLEQKKHCVQMDKSTQYFYFTSTAEFSFKTVVNRHDTSGPVYLLES